MLAQFYGSQRGLSMILHPLHNRTYRLILASNRPIRIRTNSADDYNARDSFEICASM